ncbi:MAG: hypothetical protein ACYC2I_10200 [Elusimicrobiales bacterium]
MGKRAAWTLLLTLTAQQAALCPAYAERTLPVFALDEVKVAGLPRLPDGHIPPVPPPTDTGYYSPAGMKLYSSVKLVVDGEAGRVEIDLPRGGGSGGYSTSLFVKFAGREAGAELSWAAVVCCGGRYLGYKGATLTLPAEGGELALRDDSYALGPMRALVGRTHPWLLQGAGAAEDLDRLCAPGLAAKLKAYSLAALPREAGGLRLRLERRKKLTLSWDKPRP